MADLGNTNIFGSREQMRELLREHKVSPTNQRLDIASVILDRPQHLTADQILQKVNQSGGRVSKATVYNTLKCFVDNGLLKQVQINQQHVLYDSTVKHHHHIYNEDTGELSDIDASSINVGSLPNLPHGLEHRSVEVLIRVGKTEAA